MSEMEAIGELLTKFDCGEIFFADDAQQKAALWILRRRAAEAVKLDGFTIEEDTVVPRAELPALIKGVKLLGEQYNFKAVCYGHAGDGNLHIRIKKEELVTATNKPLNLTPLQQDSVKKYLSTLTTSFYETARWMLVNNK